MLSLAGADSHQRTLNQAKAHRDNAFKVALKTVLWLTNEEVANVKYRSLIHFLQNLGVEDAKSLKKSGNAQYTSPKIFNQLLDALNAVSIQVLKAAISNSPFVGIGIDESTDLSQEKHIAVVVRYVSVEGQVVTTFLKLEAIKDGKAQSLFDATASVLLQFGVPFSKVVGLGADGVNVMSSEQNGLNGLMKVQNPYCLYVHCVCHRLALSVSNCQQQIPALDTLTKIIGSVYNYVQYSKLERFKDISAILDMATVKFKRLFEIRWLCLGEAVVAVIRNYEPLMVLLSQDANNGDPTAIGLNQQLSSFKWVALLHLVADVLNTINHLSRLFQHNDVSFSAIRGEVKNKFLLRLTTPHKSKFNAC